MIATGRAGLPKIELMADRLLLVEGKDEVNLLGGSSRTVSRTMGRAYRYWMLVARITSDQT